VNQNGNARESTSCKLHACNPRPEARLSHAHVGSLGCADLRPSRHAPSPVSSAPAADHPLPAFQRVTDIGSGLVDLPLRSGQCQPVLECSAEIRHQRCHRPCSAIAWRPGRQARAMARSWGSAGRPVAAQPVSMRFRAIGHCRLASGAASGLPCISADGPAFRAPPAATRLR
jgi:hypothetical protein